MNVMRFHMVKTNGGSRNVINIIKAIKSSSSYITFYLPDKADLLYHTKSY